MMSFIVDFIGTSYLDEMTVRVTDQPQYAPHIKSLLSADLWKILQIMPNEQLNVSARRVLALSEDELVAIYDLINSGNAPTLTV